MSECVWACECVCVCVCVCARAHEHACVCDGDKDLSHRGSTQTITDVSVFLLWSVNWHGDHTGTINATDTVE